MWPSSLLLALPSLAAAGGAAPASNVFNGSQFTSDSTQWPAGIARLKSYALSRPNGKLRFVLPNEFYVPPHFVRGEPYVPVNGGVDGSNLQGAMPNFVGDLLRPHGIEWEQVPLSEEAMAWTGSSFTGSVYDVAAGNADLGLANILQLSTRWRLAPFGSTIYGACARSKSCCRPPAR